MRARELAALNAGIHRLARFANKLAASARVFQVRIRPLTLNVATVNIQATARKGSNFMT
jgi:hypothetical protein